MNEQKKGGIRDNFPCVFDVFSSIFARTAAPLRCVVEVFGPSRQWCVGWIVGQELPETFVGNRKPE